MNSIFNMGRTRGAALGLAGATALALSAGAASAGILATGDNALAGTTTAIQPQLAGTVAQDVDTPVSFKINGGTFAATVQSRVVLADDGTYDFYWRIYDTSFTRTTNVIADLDIGPGVLQAFRLDNFGIPIAGLNGDYATDGLGDVGPDNAHLFGSPQDQAVNFTFFGSGGLHGGQDSYFFFLDTNAHSYNHNAIFDVGNNDGTANSDVFSTFGAGGGVPEPGVWTMMIAGFGLAGAMLRTRRRLALA